MKGKPFKESAFGKFLTKNLPDIADLIGDKLPDAGVIGIVKRIISKREDISPEVKDEFDKLAADHEREMYALEVQDRDSARDREVEMAKAGRTDWMMYFVGVFVLILSSGVIYAVFYTTMVNSEMSHFIAGEVIGFAASVVMYYYGASYKGQKTGKT